MKDRRWRIENGENGKKEKKRIEKLLKKKKQ